MRLYRLSLGNAQLGCKSQFEIMGRVEAVVCIMHVLQKPLARMAAEAASKAAVLCSRHGLYFSNRSRLLHRRACVMNLFNDLNCTDSLLDRPVLIAVG